MEITASKMQIDPHGNKLSKDINEFFNNVGYDLNALYALAAQHGIEIPRNYDILLRENISLERKINSLESRIDALADVKRVVSFYDTSSVEAVVDCVVNTDYGYVARDTDEVISKIYVPGVNSNFIPRTLGVKLYESTSTVADITTYASGEVTDSNILMAFDGTPSTVWQRNSIQETNIDTLYAVLHLTLPTNIVNHMRVNSITLDPSPEYAFDIMDIQYKTASQWHRVSTFGNEEGTPTAHTSIPKEELIFPKQDVTELVIYIRHTASTTESAHHVFTYGFKDIGINYKRFSEDNSGNVVVSVVHPGAEYFKKITDITVEYDRGGIVGTEVPLLSLYSDFSSTRAYGGASSDVPLNTKTIYIKAPLVCDDSGTSPMIKRIVVDHTSI